MPTARLFVTADLVAGLAVALTAPQAHYLTHVLRLSTGATLALFNGRDGEWQARLEATGKRVAAIPIEQRRQQELAPDLWLLFAPVKRAPIDFLAAKATELGVAALYPVTTRRTVVERVNLDRLTANVIEAAEQSERLSVPEVHPPQPLERLVDRWPAGRRLLLCDESGLAPPIAAALQALPLSRWAVLVGPEGGFAETELDALRKLPFVCAVGLGPRVLRSDTAALAALAVVQALHGDWAAARAR